MTKEKKYPEKLPQSFYDRRDVLEIARDLLGKIIVTNINGHLTAGRIVEDEAYVAFIDNASHSFGGKRTQRNEHMYAAAGTAYIYICYGLHQMMNVVTNKAGVPDAILIRAVEPVDGIRFMAERTSKEESDFTITRGPGNVGKALGIHKKYSGESLQGNLIYICDDGFIPQRSTVGISERIGVEGAGKDAHLPYRFYIKNNSYVSGKRN